MRDHPTVNRSSLARLSGFALLVVVATDAVGGLWDIAAGRSSVVSAWGPSATLCAPWPMIAFQVAAVLVIGRGRVVVVRWAVGLLAVACVVSVLSGFFDGQLGRADLGVAERAFQGWLLLATGVLGWTALVCWPVDAGTPTAQKRKRLRRSSSHACTDASRQA